MPVRRHRFLPRVESLGTRAVPSADLAGVAYTSAADPAPAAQDVDPTDPGGPLTVDMTGAFPVAPTDAY